MIKASILMGMSLAVSLGGKYGDNNLSDDAVMISSCIFIAAAVACFSRGDK